MNQHRWKKLGQLFSADFNQRHPAIQSHAANPLPLHLEGDVYRILFSCRDAQNRSSVGRVDVDILRREIVQTHDQPLFEYGPEDSFYADGVSLGNDYCVDGERFVLFMGWQNNPPAHWRGDIGRLILDRDLDLSADSPAPLMSSDETDPLSLSYPWVMPDPGGGYRMWYGSTVTWDAGNGEMLHVINHAVSADGHRWQRLGLAVPYQIGVAQAFSRPTVSGNPDSGYHMWFSYRSGQGTKYRIGYAYSEDLVHWRLALGNSGIDVSTQGWDAEMIEYPYVFMHREETYMLYNGNAHGKTGFGIAVLDQ